MHPPERLPCPQTPPHQQHEATSGKT
jgi:hypothetical protein